MTDTPIDTARASREDRRALFTQSGLSSSVHTLRLEVVGDSSRHAMVDAVEVTGGPGLIDTGARSARTVVHDTFNTAADGTEATALGWRFRSSANPSDRCLVGPRLFVSDGVDNAIEIYETGSNGLAYLDPTPVLRSDGEAWPVPDAAHVQLCDQPVQERHQVPPACHRRARTPRHLDRRSDQLRPFGDAFQAAGTLSVLLSAMCVWRWTPRH